MTINQINESTTIIPQEPSAKPSRALLVGALIFFLIFTISLLLALYDIKYKEKAFPGIVIGGIEVGGMKRQDIEDAIYKRYEEMIKNGISVSFEEEIHIINLNTSTNPEFSFELIKLDVQSASAHALQYGHNGTWYQNIGKGLFALVKKTDLSILPFIEMNRSVISEELIKQFSNAEHTSQLTDFIYDPKSKVTTIQMGTQGTELDRERFFMDLEKNIEDLAIENMTLSITDAPKPIPVSLAQSLIPQFTDAINRAPFTLTYKTDTQREYTWQIKEEELAEMLIPVRYRELDTPNLSIEDAKLHELFAKIEQTINVAPMDARFRIENGKVIEFAGSQNGVAFDREATRQNIINAIFDDTVQTIAIIAKTTPPETSTSEVNNLGITEVLGVGTSSWSGSPRNRIINIRHATEKLNGLLIAPQERISLLSKLAPLTLEDGYLPELVILGDEIKPEIAGGLCQIGTTTFRAVMNAGLQVDERRNHSLVVSYYNDPSNKNPGTDATLYEPHPDLQFTNTTNHHILLTTEFDEEDKKLIYTFWGTSDGRKGYYTPPQVLSWRDPGPTVYKDSTSLAPGQEKCQAEHAGATTTFDYIIEKPDGTKDIKTFDSFYRALPRICLVGVDPNSAPSEPTPRTDDIPDESTQEEPVPLAE